MADDPNLEPGRSFDIATDGVGIGRPITVATRGFIVPIIGDLIIGGEAGVVFGQFDVIGEGGIIIDGAAQFKRTIVYAASGGLTFGGDAEVSTEVVPVTGGQIIIGGGASVLRTFAYSAIGGLVTGGSVFGVHRHNHIASGGIGIGGDGFVNFSLTANIDGGIIINGEADVSTPSKLQVSRGGAMNRPAWRWNKKPTITWEPADPQIELSPIDYLKRIQDKIKQREPKTFDHKSDGTIRMSGSGQLTVIYRDVPDSPVIVADSAPLTPIQMDVSSLFRTGSTAREIAEFEDTLLMSDLLGKGQYRIKTGNKARFVHCNNKGPKGTAGVSFTSASAKAKHTDFVAELVKAEDEELVLGDDARQTWEHEEEELRLLGIIG